MFESDKIHGGNKLKTKSRAGLRGSGMLSGGQFSVSNKI